VKDWEKILRTTLKQRWKRYRRTLKSCQREFSQKSVHASRVEARRLLSLVDLLDVFVARARLKKVRRMLKRHLDAFDPLRDTQVQLLLLKEHEREFPETKSFHRTLIKREASCLKSAARGVKHVKTRPMQEAFAEIARQLARRRRDPAQRARQRAAVLAAARDAFARTLTLQRAMDPGAAETIHRTRLAFKRYRYMMEALQPLFAEIAPERVAAMQEFQSMMGTVQDTEVFLARLDKHTRDHELRARTLARFRRWLLVRHTAQITYCLKHAGRLHEFWPLDGAHSGKTLAAARTRRAALNR
jgi:CHAD domain-containing protein